MTMKRFAIAFVLALGLGAAWPAAQNQIGHFLRILFTVDAKTIASNGTSAAATYTLTPSGSYVTVTNNDPDGATITMGEPSGVDGMPVTIVNIGSNPITFNYSSGVSELAGTIKLAQYDSICEDYVSDRWVGCGHKSVYGPVELTGTLHLTDAQVKNRPTTNSGITEIVPASSGYAQIPRWAAIVCDSTAAVYTAIDANAAISIQTNDTAGYGTAYLEQADSNSSARVSALLATGASTMVLLPMYGAAGDSTDILGLPIPSADYSGNIVLNVYNNSTNFTGGSGSNTGCDITVGYLRIKVTGL